MVYALAEDRCARREDAVYSRLAEVPIFIRPAVWTPYGFRGETQVVDTTGAGDCYTAGFFFRYAKTQDLADAVRFGSMVAYHVIEQRGGVVTRRMPTSEQVEDALKGWGE